MSTQEQAQLPDVLARYVEGARAPFESMRGAASQLAGFLLLLALDRRNALGQAARVDALGDLLSEAEGQLYGNAPRGMVAVHHHRHMREAMLALRQAHVAARELLAGGSLPAERCERPLNQAIAQLRHAANALPGFALVDLADCCGAGRPAGN